MKGQRLYFVAASFVILLFILRFNFLPKHYSGNRKGYKLDSEGQPNKKLDEQKLEVEKKENGDFLLDQQKFKSAAQIAFNLRPKKQRKAFALRRRGDPALNYMKRKEALINAGFSVQLHVYSSWSACNMELSKKTRNFVDLLLCLSKSYCLNDELYMRFENEGIYVDRILGQLEFWSNKKGFCSALRNNLKPKTAKGLKWIEYISFDCYVIPRDLNELQLAASKSTNVDSGWVFKPDDTGGGSGIFVKDGKEALLNYFVKNDVKRTFVVQKKLSSPYLIHGRKFDMRTHVLVASISPLRAYVHKNGIIRFAGDRYTNSSSNRRSEFLTNLSVNNKGVNRDDLTWSFHELRSHLGDMAPTVFKRVDKIIGQMLLTTEKSFRSKFTKVSSSFSCSNCYQQIGVDILLDENLQPHIMEINGNPMQNFKSDKISALCVKFQNDITKLLYTPVNESKVLKSLNSYFNDRNRTSSLNQVLNSKMFEYIVRLYAEHMSNNEGFRLVYPPTASVVSIAEQEEWLSLLLNLSEEDPRIRFHELLISLERQRVADCRDFHRMCSAEVDDILHESPYTIFKAEFPI